LALGTSSAADSPPTVSGARSPARTAPGDASASSRAHSVRSGGRL